MNIKKRIIWLSVVLAFSTVAEGIGQAQSVGNDEYSSGFHNHKNYPRPWANHAEMYPACADIISEYQEKTNEIFDIGEDIRSARSADQVRVLRKERTALAEERQEIDREVRECIHDEATKPRIKRKQKDKGTLLKGTVKKDVKMPSDEAASDDVPQEKESDDIPSGDSSSNKQPQTKPKVNSPQKKPHKTIRTKPRPKNPNVGPPATESPGYPPTKKKPEQTGPNEGPAPKRPPIPPRPPHDIEVPEPNPLPPLKEPTSPKPVAPPKPQGPNFSMMLVDPPPFAYMKGLGKGFQECVGDVVASAQVLWQVTQAMMAGDYPSAEQISGIPGQVLQGIWNDFNKPIILSPKGGKVTPEEHSQIAYENGKAAARRICEAVPIERTAKCISKVCKFAGKTGKKITKKIGGKLPKKSQVPEGEVFDTPTAKPVGGGSGGTVKTPPVIQNAPDMNPVRGPPPYLSGKFRGKGSFGKVSELPDHPGKLLKEFDMEIDLETARMLGPDAVASLNRSSAMLQHEGYNLIKDFSDDIPTPKLSEVGLGTNPPYVIIDDIQAGVWKEKGAYLAKESIDPRGELQAVNTLRDNLAKKGMTLLDPNKGNIFFFHDTGGLKAGIVDPQFILRPGDLVSSPHGVLIDNVINTFGDRFKGAGQKILDAIPAKGGVTPEALQKINQTLFEENGWR